MNINIKQLAFWRYLASAFSGLTLVAALLALTLNGLNWGMDFTGGVVTEVEIAPSHSSQELTQRLNAGLEQEVGVVQAGQPGRWSIRHGEAQPGALTVMEVLKQVDPEVTLLNSSTVGSQVGQEMAEMGGLAVLAALICILLYLSVRFEWRLACGALLALFYDVLVVLGLFAATGLEFNLTILAAVMAVVGYSLNDSIVIADRIRELLVARPNEALAKINDDAVAQTFARTLVTTGTTLTTVGALWLFGGASLTGFALALFVGILSGTWSSISIGTVLPQWLGLKPEHYQTQPIPETP
ncbi:protein translocase subunit SecF [Ferrimonas marina]|uniref:Protein-export membrane protein SecF n=1 Tax=Ferrimonas marina TaxID=299255 RepID=A0A1M5RJI8_9GAMM|nr:protein translocase subunit SecF [Ferrimonas marina]SHH26542.1 preprotein translocase subunit SecF [Ferrimonas marina]